MKAPGADPSAKLAATMLEVGLAEVAEGERLRRGRRYARQGAVLDLVVARHVVTGSVQGSRAQPYQVEIRLLGSATPATSRLADLVPASNRISFQCTCPDWESPCKHGAAVLTQLAERVAYEPSLLLTWRGADAATVEDVDDTADEEPAPATASDSVLATALAEFVGTAPSVELPELRPLPHVHMSWDEPWSVMLHDALRVLSGGHSSP